MADKIHQKLAQAVIDGQLEDAKALAQEALEQGLDVHACISKGLVRGIKFAGKLHANGNISLSDMIKSSNAMEAALIVFEPPFNNDDIREIISLVVIEQMDTPPGEDRKTLIGTMLTDGEPADDDSQELPILHWIS